DPLWGEHVSSCRAFPGSRRYRAAAEQRGRSLLQIRTAFPAAQSSFLDGVAGGTSARPTHPGHRGAVPNVSVSAWSVWLVDASQDRATVRRAKISGGRDHGRWTN